MQKVYLLLRNNRQIGPHSLEELVKLGLKPHDLVWVEGKSAGWLYPTEIEALKPYVLQADGTTAATPPPAPPAPQTPVTPPAEKQVEVKAQEVEKTPSQPTGGGAKHVFVSMPAKAASVPQPKEPTPEEKLAQKAEALRQRAQSFSQEAPAPPKSEVKKEDVVATPYTRSLEEVEEAYTSWVYKQKTEKKQSSSKRGLAIAAVVLSLAVVSYFIINENASRKSDVAGVAPKEAIQEENGTPAQPVEQAPVESTESETLPTSKTVAAEQSVASTPPKPEQKKEVQKPVPDSAVDQPPLVTSGKADNTAAEGEVTSTDDNTAASTDPVEKKKSLGEKIDDFFEKFKTKKTEDATAKEPASTEDVAGAERNSTKREENSTTSGESVNLTPYVDVTASEPAENWMMGIKGLKITLKNNSNETVKTAAVEVRYYDEQDALLEKKTVYFNNVPPKKSLTLPAPDHRLAAHTDYQLLSASGTEDGYARQ